MGYNIGTRLIEDFLARSNMGRCADFREVGEVVAKVSGDVAWAVMVVLNDLNCADVFGLQVGFKSFLNITPNVTHSAQAPASSPTRTSMPPPQANAAGSSFTLSFDENPLAEFVELPEEALEGGLWFSNVLCGVLRGALEMVRDHTHAQTTQSHPFWNTRSRCR